MIFKNVIRLATSNYRMHLPTCIQSNYFYWYTLVPTKVSTAENATQCQKRFINCKWQQAVVNDTFLHFLSQENVPAKKTAPEYI